MAKKKTERAESYRANIAAWCARRGLTAYRLRQDTGMSDNTFGAFMTPDGTVPNLTTLICMAEQYKVTVEEIISAEEEAQMWAAYWSLTEDQRAHIRDSVKMLAEASRSTSQTTESDAHKSPPAPPADRSSSPPDLDDAHGGVAGKR